MKVHILLGAPGSGKGTQAKRLVDRFSLTHLSTGDILRDAVSKGTELGLKVKAIMAEGKLVDDDTVNGLVFARLQDETQDVLFDGYPRTKAQAQALQDFLSQKHVGPQFVVGAVVEVDVPREVLEARVVGRRVCSNNGCGAIYHLESKPSQKAGVCDVCGSPLKHRSDDTAEAFRARMAEFDSTYQPLKAFYADRPTFLSVDGNRHPDQVFGTLETHFKEQA
jgi:adenylate kinase